MDLTFLILVFVILTIGLIMLFSASYVDALYREGDSFFYIKKQFIFALVGIAAMFFIAYVVDYHILHRFAVPILLVTEVLLVVVYFCPPVNGVTRWIPLPIVGTIQPSEIAKFAVITMFAHIISLNFKKMDTFKGGVLPFLPIILTVVPLVLFERHLSGGILIALICAVMMLVGGTKLRWFGLAGAGAGAAAVAAYFLGLLDSVWSRIEVFIDPFVDARGAGFQNIQALYAICSGGLMGLGLGNSRQKYLYIPEPQNDFIFAIVCEELGFVGAAIIIILFALLVWRGFVIASKAKDKFGSMLVIGVVSQIGLQTILNIAVVTKSVPNTGIPLPFFSYGGSALLILLAEIGVVLNVSRHSMMEKN
ncbi:MAG: cell division protein FtsW [Ruminococcaceae bacterium]|nr:cell division protein FtsW [Oscillospiraceae bacterium]